VFELQSIMEQNEALAYSFRTSCLHKQILLRRPSPSKAKNQTHRSFRSRLEHNSTIFESYPLVIQKGTNWDLCNKGECTWTWRHGGYRQQEHHSRTWQTFSKWHCAMLELRVVANMQGSLLGR